MFLKNSRNVLSLTCSQNFTKRFRRSKSKSTSFPADYCVDLVRQNDHENFLCTLLVSESIRTTAFAVRAFNTEVARVSDVVSNTNIAQMRLKFWEEAVEKIFSNNPPEHPVAKEIYRALNKHKLSKLYFSRLVTSRRNQILKNGFPNLESMEQYSENSVSSVFYLLLQAAGVQDMNVDHAVSHLGKAQGITNSLRALPHLAKNPETATFPLPIDLLLKHNVSTEAILRGGNDGLKEVAYEVASRAKLHVDKAKSLSSKFSRDTFLICLPIVPVMGFLTRLQKANFNVFDPSLSLRDNFLPVKLFWAKFRSSY
ncbi:hypothetical protein J437_LFUL009175 [Ladona fulva]|uniref:NADH dehydrogenase (Ubiquinone) complex I, assembly factor 6 n=1 Tax=Ladona fulva TaxID=123851 RepID=A0A8K0K273_LADFU|nr:hypothetical protein J437_LFUL009175 [Ladona fulva]